jgi:hypothetical protein
MNSKVALKFLQFLLAIAALMFWGSYGIARSTFMREGSRVSDALHAIELDQHGSIAYITKHQSHVLSSLVACSIACFVVAAGIDLYRRGRLPKLARH